MEANVSTSVKEVSETLFRLLIHPSASKLEGELYYDDDAWRFRNKGLDIQDFAPSYIDIHSYIIKKNDDVTGDIENGEQNIAHAPQSVFNALEFSFSYIPDPTWLVNWENGTYWEEGYETELTRMPEETKNFDLDLGEYLNGVEMELVEDEDEGDRIRLLSLSTNKKRKLTVNKLTISKRGYMLQLPNGFGIVGRFPAPRYSFGFYVGWMNPKSWSIRNHLWFPSHFRLIVRSLLLTFHRLAIVRRNVSRSSGSTPKDDLYYTLPESVFQRIVQQLSTDTWIPPTDEMKPGNWEFIDETEVV